jgi:hypothetical protein
VLGQLLRVITIRLTAEDETETVELNAKVTDSPADDGVNDFSEIGVKLTIVTTGASDRASPLKH